MGKSAGFFQEEDGHRSMTRLTIFLIVAAYICWATNIVLKTSVIPDLPYGLAGLLVGLYGLNTANITIGGGTRDKA